jgi:hypothetical protein
VNLDDLKSDPVSQANRILTTLCDFTQMARESGLVPPAVDAEDQRRLTIVAAGHLPPAVAETYLLDMLPAIAAELARVAEEVARQRRVAPATPRTLH